MPGKPDAPGTELDAAADRAPTRDEQREAGTVLVRALRRWGDEAQFTQALGAMAAADAGFARGFVKLVLKIAERDAAGDKVRKFRAGGLPKSFDCRAEASLVSTREHFGRVDLRFDGDDMTLLIENKLHSGYGREQVARYLAALSALPRDGRSALIAITRDVPTIGEQGFDDDPAWLGSIRWARLYDGLRDLPVQNTELGAQWRALLTVLKEDGDLGGTTADIDLVKAWALYRRGRAHLEDLLSQIWSPALEAAQGSFTAKHRTGIPAAEIAEVYRRGRSGQIVVQRDQRSVYVGLKIPATRRDSNVWFGFYEDEGQPEFRVGVNPWEGDVRLERGEKQLVGAIRELEQAGFLDLGTWAWAKAYGPEHYLTDDDVPERLLSLVREDLALIAKTRVLAQDISLVAARKRGGPPRVSRRNLNRGG